MVQPMEGMEAVEETSGTSDVVVLISAGAEKGSEKFKQGGDSQGRETFEPEKRTQELTSPSSHDQDKVLDRSVTRRRSLARSATYLQPASRLVEPPSDVSNSAQNDDPPNMASYSPTSPRSPQLLRRTRSEVSDEEEVVLPKDGKPRVQNGKPRVQMKGMMLVLEWIAFVCLMGFLIASLVIDRLKDRMIWSLEIWKWCVLVMLSLCGRLITGWLTPALAFLVDKDIMPYRNILFFAHSISVRVFVWLGLVLVAWGLLICRGVHRPKDTSRILNYVTRALASSLIGTAMWMAKTILLKILTASVQIQRFYGRIENIFFQQYVIETLSGRPPDRIGGFKEQQKMADGDAIGILNRDISAWTTEILIRIVADPKWKNFFFMLNESGGQKKKEISSAEEAERAANIILRNVALPGHSYIDDEDLARFMVIEEVDAMFTMFEGAAATRKITRPSLVNWMVNVYNRRKYLVHSLSDTSTGIRELNKVVSWIVFVLIVIVWLLLMGLATTKVLVFISSQLLLLVFVFGNTCARTFEAIIFVFVMHPFDIGDRCLVDEVQLQVEKITIMATIFLTEDNEKMYYPNSVLATKTIRNFNRSPDMNDSVEFAIDVSTSDKRSAALVAAMGAYLGSKPERWWPSFNIRMKGLEDTNMKMVLSVTHNMKFQDYREKTRRRSELAYRLKETCEELGIKCHRID